MEEKEEQRRRGGGGGEEVKTMMKEGGGGGGGGGGGEEKETLMMELSRLVEEKVKGSSWWERRGEDSCILGTALISLIPAFLLLSSYQVLCFSAGLLLMGVAHAVITIKGAHLASHGALSESSTWANIWAVFFIEICGAFSARAGVQSHIKMHHAHTNVIGLGDSSVWKAPFLSRSVYLFLAPLAVPIITPLIGFSYLRGHSPGLIARTVLMVSLGLYSQFWLLVHVSGFKSTLSALGCMLVCRAMFSLPYIHVNIFQHIGLAMFSQTSRPKRIHQMTHGVLNLSRNPVLDWVFGHSLISCHVEHHLFPFLSDHMCLKVKPVVSQYLRQKKLPYQEDSYKSRLRFFYRAYQELMVLAPPITELVGVQ